MALQRRQADRRMTVFAGGRGKGPGKVIVLRADLVERQMDDQVDWHEVAEAATKIADFARSRQERAWQRVKAWDSIPDIVA